MPAHGTPGFTGARLREAREARGLTAASLAELLGVKRQAISQYEHGQTAPAPDKLYLLAAKLNLPVDFFVQSARPPRTRPIFFRSQAAATKSSRAKAETRLEWLGDLLLYVESYVELPGVHVPELQPPGIMWTFSAIEAAAQSVRAAWGLGEDPIPNVISVAERNGAIATRGIVETETIDAFSVKLPGGRPALFLGADKDSAVRSRFDAAHEIGHHVLHGEFGPIYMSEPTVRKRVEDEAHRFASAFLLPASEFARDLRAPTLEGMLFAKSRWGASVGTMIQRCADLEILREKEAERLWVARVKRGWNRREPLDDELVIEQPTVLRSAIELMVSQGARSPEQIAADIPLSPSDLEALAGLSVGYLSTAPAPIQLLSRRATTAEGSADVISFPGAIEREQRDEPPRDVRQD